jgi:N-acetylglutamate synthase-like GNAT family acetyltransferase
MSELATTVKPFNPEVDVYSDFAAMHLLVRLLQRKRGENTFTDIYDSQKDLSDIRGHYTETNPQGNFFVASDDLNSTVAGFVALSRESQDVGRIKRLAVMPEYWGQHLGIRLVSPALDWAEETGIEKIVLATGEKERARTLVYEPLGFEVVRFDEEHQNIHMELVLP